ncbi:Ultraviolet-B receptor UVR8 (Protein UV-B RESISTANCE 8) (RCC1 domain-containing protein UVR8) [Durusdinium trenchii]|uniref:Ultraviolet-B receptor UVR8 (Protein UV-B RESISTANCE 8) (RCC1 domain-containing protein UVR8) n=1 Tax=Durusdinium trenchii TaxID=1381693 RepID=A0ABP0IMK2_9DINO
MDGPEDPLATARTGGLDSVVQLDEPRGRGMLGEALRSACLSDPAGLHTVEALRGVKVAELAVGYGSTYAVDEDGQVLNLGSGTAPEDTDLAFEIDVAMETIAVGKDFGVGIGLQDKRLYSWGDGRAGQTGLGHARGSRVAEAIGSVAETTFAKVSCGEAHAVAVAEDGTLYSWGRGLEGQLGQGVSKEVDMQERSFMAFRMAPRVIQGLARHRFVHVSCGARFSAAVDTFGFVWTWGEGLTGQLGTGKCTKRTIPARVVGPGDHDQASPSVESSSAAKCKRGGDQSSVADFADILPDDLTSSLGLQEAKQASRDEDQDLAASSASSSSTTTKPSENGPGTSTQSIVTPLQVSSMSTSQQFETGSHHQQQESEHGTARHFVAVSCGESHVLALDQIGDVYVWGFNAFGQLGLGNKESQSQPVNLSACASGACAMGKSHSVSAAKHFSAAVSRTGQLFFWGSQPSNPGGSKSSPTKLETPVPDAHVAFAQATGNGGAIMLLPTHASKVSPSNGPLKGGHAMEIHGVGFWDSPDIKVRFVPLKRKDAQEDQVVQDQRVDDADGATGRHSTSQASEANFDTNVEFGDELSETSSTSSEEKDQDLRELVVVQGTFDPTKGSIRCVVPSCAAPGVVQVQIAMDGETFTTDEVFYIYAAPCTVSKSWPAQAWCASSNPTAESELTVSGTEFLAMPELCIQLSVDGRHVQLPARLVVPQDPQSADTTQDSEAPPAHDAMSEAEESAANVSAAAEQDLQVRAIFNVNRVFADLGLGGLDAPSVICASVHVSLNGVSLSKSAAPGDACDGQAPTLTLARGSIQSCFPQSLQCLDDLKAVGNGEKSAANEGDQEPHVVSAHTEEATVTEDAQVSKDTADPPDKGLESDEGGTVKDGPAAETSSTTSKTSLANRTLTLHCQGLLDQLGIGTGVAKVCFVSPGELSLPEVDGEINCADDTIVLEAPLLPRSALPNGEGWGFVNTEVVASLDDGRTWMSLGTPFVFFWGSLAPARPTLCPTDVSTSEITVGTSAESRDWLFGTADPVVSIKSCRFCDIELAVSAVELLPDGSGLSVALSEPKFTFDLVRERARECAFRQAFDAFKANRMPPKHDSVEGDEDAKQPDDAPQLSEEELQEIEQGAEEAGNAAAEDALRDMLVELELSIALNGRDVHHAFPQDPVILYVSPTVVSIQPDTVQAGTEAVQKAAAEASAEEAQQTLRVELECTVALPGPKHVRNALIRFAHLDGGPILDVSAHVVEEETQEAHGAEEQGNARRRTMACTAPSFQVAGLYQVLVALNGVSFEAAVQLEPDNKPKSAEEDEEEGVDSSPGPVLLTVEPASPVSGE